MQWIKTNGWKALGVVLVLYTLIFGVLSPLKPGITGISPAAVSTDTLVRLQVSGYNTHFTEAESHQAWLRLTDDFLIVAEGVEIQSDQLLTATFRIPPFLPVPEPTIPATLIINNPIDGAAVKPSAVFISADSSNVDLGYAYWKKATIEGLVRPGGMRFPFRGILEETIRNTYFHVPMWFGMILLFLASLVYSTRYLRGSDPLGAEKSRALNLAGVVFGILGLITGAIWAKFTWNAFWSMDVKQNMAAIATMIYLAYFILRSAFEDPDKRDRVSSAYNIFAFVTLIPLLFIIPRLTDSLHPGNGGNPALGGEDLDNTMRLVFYPAVIGWTLLGFWLSDLVYRLHRVEQRFYQNLMR